VATREVVKNWISNCKYTAYHSNSDKSGDSKTFVATIVANVATERMRLDTTELKGKKITYPWYSMEWLIYVLNVFFIL
jgi:hypothetical protein